MHHNLPMMQAEDTNDRRYARTIQQNVRSRDVALHIWTSLIAQSIRPSSAIPPYDLRSARRMAMYLYRTLPRRVSPMSICNWCYQEKQIPIPPNITTQACLYHAIFIRQARYDQA
jgi:hypothetical protein